MPVVEIVIPEGVVTIGSSAFYRCIGLRKVVLPSTVTTLGSSAFTACVYLKEVDMSKTQITQIKSSQFTGCVNLMHLKFTVTIKEIGSCVTNTIISSLEGKHVLFITGYSDGPAETFAANNGYYFESLGVTPHFHEMEAVAAVTPSCIATGNIAYYKCTGCEKLYTDELGENEITLEETMTDEEKEIADILGLTEAGTKEILSFAEKNNISTDVLLIKEETILAQKTEENGKAVYGLLSGRATKTTKASITLKWNKVSGADGYIIYGNKCGTRNKYKKIKTLSTNKKSFTQKKLTKGTFYKYMVVAYKTIDGKRVTIGVSKTIHAVTAGGKYGNAKSVNTNKTKYNVDKGKTVTMKASAVKAAKTLKTHRKIAFESTNPEIATVNSKGKVKGKKKGSCYIYVYAQNGVYKKVKVTVK